MFLYNSTDRELTIGNMATITFDRVKNHIQVTTHPTATKMLLSAIAECIDLLKLHTDSTGSSIIVYKQEPTMIPKLSDGWLWSPHYACYGWVPTKIFMFWVNTHEDIEDILKRQPQQEVRRLTTPFTTVSDFLGFLSFENQPLMSTMLCCGGEEFLTHEECDIRISSVPQIFDDSGNLIIYSITVTK